MRIDAVMAQFDSTMVEHRIVDGSAQDVYRAVRQADFIKTWQDFWGGETRWRDTEASDFAFFAEPGLARIACNFSLRPYGAGRTLVSYEARTQATDTASRRSLPALLAVRVAAGRPRDAGPAGSCRARSRPGGPPDPEAP